MENKPDCTQRDGCSIISYALVQDMDRSQRLRYVRNIYIWFS